MINPDQALPLLFFGLLTDLVVVVEVGVVGVAEGVGDEAVVEAKVQCLLLKNLMLNLMHIINRFVI